LTTSSSLILEIPTSITPPPSFEEIREQYHRIEKEILRRQYVRDPDLWAEHRMKAFLWSGQRKILTTVAMNRRTAIKTCHEMGKSYVDALLAAWWIDSHPVGSAFVVTSAPTASQVKAILWREIRRAHTRGKLAGRTNKTEWYLPVGDKEELVAFGRKPDEYNPDAFQGIHALFVLVIFDEGNGIRGPLWEAADSLIANDNSKIVVTGNPDDPSGEFFEASKPGSGCAVVEFSAFDTPNFTGEPIPEHLSQLLIGHTYVEEKRRKWASNWIWVDRDGQPCEPAHGVRCVPPEGARSEDTNPYWQSKILGLFPEHADSGGLIPISWIRAAQTRTLKPEGANHLGQDVGAGGDASTVAHRRGGVVRIINEDHNPDTMQTCGLLIGFLKSKNASLAKVDMIGIGRGIADRAKELKQPVIGINVGEAPWPAECFDIEEGMDPEGFMNLRAQLYWWLRMLFEKGLIDIDAFDDDLAGELVEIRYKRLSSGKIQIESKGEAKNRGIPSPNRAEAVMLSVAPEPPKKKRYSATW